MKTVNGIYNDINESDYIVEYNGFKFYFSSNVYAEKFKLKIDDYIKQETIKLELKYKSKLDITDLLSFNLYQIIEKRGFKVVNSEGVNLNNSPLFKLENTI